MKIIGITGGVGSGKSAVLDLLQSHFNAAIIKADDVAKDTMKPGCEGYKQVTDIFGSEILCEDGTINRPLLSQIIFKSPNKRIVLNSIIHPLVKKFIIEETGRLKALGLYDYTFIEAALLIEDHYQVICDEFWYIYVPEQLRRSRLKASRGYTDEKIDDIFKSQLSEEEFRQNCTQVIDNSKDLDFTLSQLEKLL